MSTTAGVWSETLLQNVRMRSDAIRFDDRQKLDYQPRIDIINLMQRVNTAKLLPLNDGRKNYTLELMWMNNCDIAATQCDHCTFTGTELSSNIQQYTLTECAQASAQIQEYDFWTNDFGYEEAIAKAQLTIEIRLIEQVVWDYLAVIQANAGTNQWNGDAALATVFANETRIAPVNYTANNVIPYLLKVASFNQFNQPVMASGDLLYTAYQQAVFNASGVTQNIGDQARFGAMPWFWDLWNFNVLGLNLYQFMINVGATAFASRGIYGPTPDFWDNANHWSRPSVFFPELIIDWSSKDVCVHDMKSTVIVGKAHWLNAVNPAGCNEANTGILTFHSL